MLSTAYGGAGIALATAAIVVLISTRSFLLTIYSIITIVYIIAATTAMLVATGWTLGFLESVCFAILIGVSCDFVLHFGHSYASLPGNVSRHERTKYAMVIMGPSILAAAFTTISAAAIMLFTVITFFQRFATILFYTMIQASIGSFIFFSVLTDTVGPSEPTFLVDRLCSKMCGKKKEEMEDLVPGTEQTPAKTVVEGSSIPPLDSTVNAENMESEKQSMTDDQPINRHPH
jgi:5-methyltetrahydrofolate--homocysteine methyltransferase